MSDNLVNHRKVTDWIQFCCFSEILPNETLWLKRLFIWAKRLASSSTVGSFLGCTLRLMRQVEHRLSPYHTHTDPRTHTNTPVLSLSLSRAWIFTWANFLSKAHTFSFSCENFNEQLYTRTHTHTPIWTHTNANPHIYTCSRFFSH